MTVTLISENMQMTLPININMEVRLNTGQMQIYTTAIQSSQYAVSAKTVLHAFYIWHYFTKH
jgi:hypothetical protein